MSRRRLIGFAMIVLVVAVLVWMAGCGSGNSRSGPPPFSVTDSEVRAECMTGTFVPEEAGFEIREKPAPKAWRRIEEAPQAMPAERGAVKVTLRPKEPGAAETVTLTNITFQVFELGIRPIGVVFYKPCARRLAGPAVEASLDQYGPPVDQYEGSITASSADPNGSLQVGFHLPPHPQPIEFPFTVSLRKPLNLYLAVEALHTYCDWTARISWTSDSSEGVIRVDNDGRKYRIVDGAGSLWEKPTTTGQWATLPEAGGAIGVG
jgi:hypothetical protein